ncbi:HypC/HybG/HupF family hydrogenase formation chaperone [Pseudonocardia nematodicida]|uniref:HypC/HybG/HupF family hydrogenase formation chaperone n=1 Tax=Pseudonocardia nematodicida TaxID=1206997 RepID=A0ABV1K6F7_9PSEU
MCLGIPGEVVELMSGHEDLAMVSVEGVQRAVNIGLLRDDDSAELDLRPGDWILIHVGFALSTIDEAEAKASLEWLTGTGDAYTDELDALRASDITDGAGLGEGAR